MENSPYTNFSSVLPLTLCFLIDRYNEVTLILFILCVFRFFNKTLKLNIMKKVFTLLVIVATTTIAFAQTPYDTNGVGLSVVFCDGFDVADTNYIIKGHTNGQVGNQPGDTSNISIVDGALKLEGGGANFAWVRFKISPDLTTYMDLTDDQTVSFKYKQLNAEALPVVIRCDASEGSTSYGAELWLEAPDVVIGSSDWDTYTTDAWAFEDWDPTKVTMLEFAVDGGEDIASPSVILDDIKIGNIELQVCPSNATGEVILAPKSYVYPNPASDVINIRNVGDEFDVTIYNSVGQTVKTVHNQKKVDIQEFKQGVYFVEVLENGNKSTSKILVK